MQVLWLFFNELTSVGDTVDGEVDKAVKQAFNWRNFALHEGFTMSGVERLQVQLLWL